MFLSMRFIVLGMIVFLCIGYPVRAQEHREWKYCEQDSDCVLVGGGCIFGAANNTFTKEAHEYYAKKNSVIECAQPLDPKTAKAICKRSSVPCMNGGGEFDGGTGTPCLSKKAECMLVQEN